ncbi:MAG: BatD family protein [Odoribacter sp.]|nr:BatD family protein [Odoribacter sp.]
MYIRRIGFLLLLLLGAGTLAAQNVEYGVGVDTNFMLIGDQQHLTFQVRTPSGVQIVFPQLKDTVVGGVEIISGPVRDSVQEKDGRWLFSEQYVITSFDTGLYVIPPLPITIKANEYDNVLRTDPLGFYVNTYVVDPQKGNYDIVMPKEVPWSFLEILPYVLWSLFGMAVIGGVIWLIVRLRKDKPLFVQEKEIIPPYEQAIGSLDGIKEEKLWQAGREKEFYTRLTDTVRLYLDGNFGISAMEQTSLETLRELKDSKYVDSRDRDRLAGLLETADFVKFAKYTPLQDENARYLEVAYEFVKSTHERWLAEEQATAKAEEATSGAEAGEKTE